MKTDTTDLADFTARHAAGAARLSAAEGWPHRADDWAALLALGRGLVALRGGTVVGTGLVLRFGPDAARLGLIVVDGAMRGQGLGRRRTEALIAPAGDRALSPWLAALGMPQAGGATAMHRGALPPPGDARIFAIASQALG